MSRIEEIEKEHDIINNQVEQKYRQTHIIRKEILELENRMKELNKEKSELLAKENKATTAEWFLKKHHSGEYLGKTNGKTKTVYGDISASCYNCKEELELWSCQTGIGSVVLGVCPKCHTTIDFSNYGCW